nr:MAG TPA: hypothetical protein [Caudoviricetes sp.]
MFLMTKIKNISIFLTTVLTLFVSLPKIIGLCFST